MPTTNNMPTSTNMPTNDDDMLNDVLIDEPVLYISKVPYSMTESEVMDILKGVNPTSVQVIASGAIAPASGVVYFSNKGDAEKAFAFYNNASLEAYKSHLKLHIKDPNSGGQDLQPATPSLHVKFPRTTDLMTLYQTFRSFGPLYSCKIYLDKTGNPKGQGLIQFFKEASVQEALKSAAVVPSNNYQNNIAHQPQSPGPEGPLVDPCNLFIKNLDANISSSDLFNHFRKFGRIISARVMRDQETGNSKGFGFVSYTNPEEADRAKTVMNNKTLGSKQIVVRLHEPKKLRETKSASTSNNGQTSPTESRAPSRRNSDIYPANAFNDYDQETLAGLAPKARREVLMSELQKRFRNIPSVPQDEVNPIIEFLLANKLQEILNFLKDPQALQQKITEARQLLHKDKSRRNLDESTPSYTTPRSTTLNTTSLAQSMLPEREKFLRAIGKFNKRHSEEILDLIMSLPKKDRSMCYFNAEYLDKKIVEAIAAVEFTHEDPSIPVPPPTFTPRDFTPTTTPPVKSPEPISLKLLATPPKMTENHYNPNDPLYEETEQFLRMLEQKPVVEQKQKLGDKLFPKVKNLGLRSAQASKVTINLLDTDDLRALAHSMNDPVKFKAKVDAAIVKVTLNK
ncbi:9561_t:CDS:2 [Paraglomus brasilianum]|uniref:9561_t:CDS:1 n=1 Tax=Paraglomus brasilianum TaxID=144538 RepID=A0A9N9AVN8_9GLOM|nr:9561_t:CDS:2 [Paraglomus brasilianum]